MLKYALTCMKMMCSHSRFDIAILDEISNWERNGVFEEVNNVGQKQVSSRWVCTQKKQPDGIVPKARLVTRGFEEFNTTDLPKVSSTCSSESL